MKYFICNDVIKFKQFKLVFLVQQQGAFLKRLEEKWRKAAEKQKLKSITLPFKGKMSKL